MTKQSAVRQQPFEHEEISDTDPTMPLPALSHLLEEDELPVPTSRTVQSDLTADLTIECLMRLIELMGVMTGSVERIAAMLDQQASAPPSPQASTPPSPQASAPPSPQPSAPPSPQASTAPTRRTATKRKTTARKTAAKKKTSTTKKPTRKKSAVKKKAAASKARTKASTDADANAKSDKSVAAAAD